MSIYTNILDKVESEGITNAVVRFNKDGVEFFAFLSDISDTVKVNPSIVEDLSNMGFDIDLVSQNGTAVNRYINHIEGYDGDYLSEVWTILRRFRRYTSLEKYIKMMSDSFIAKVKLADQDRHIDSDEQNERNANDAVSRRLSDAELSRLEDWSAFGNTDKITLEDYKNRQLRCYTNKLKHGFNVTDFQKEARFILKELSELMDAIEHNDVENLIEELGDIVIFCYGIAEMAHKDLDTQVFKKMAINESRVYTRNEHGDFVRQGD